MREKELAAKSVLFIQIFIIYVIEPKDTYTYAQ
jgi:hypothetical protein